MSTLLIESTSVAQATQKDGRWRAVLITPGQGSSGFYSEAMLKEFGPIALRKGAKSFVTHNRMENGEPDPFQMWGVLTEDAHYEDGVGLVGEIEVLPSWREKVAEVAPHTGLSVYVMGEADAEGNVVSLIEHATNGVDLVAHPGREGSALVEKLYESMKNSVTAADTKKESRSTMEISEVAAKVDSLATVVEAFIANQNERNAERDAQVATVEEALTNYRAAASKIEEAELLPSQKSALLAEAAKGTDVSERIVEAQKVRDEAKALVESVEYGRVVGSTAAGDNFAIEGWKF